MLKNKESMSKFGRCIDCKHFVRNPDKPKDVKHGSCGVKPHYITLNAQRVLYCNDFDGKDRLEIKICDNCKKVVENLYYMGIDNEKTVHFCHKCKMNTPTKES